MVTYDLRADETATSLFSKRYMCGISGIVGIDDERHELAVHRMMRAMPHRGPDDEGCETVALGQGGSVILGFRRLSIMDLTSAGHQPMIDPITGNCLVFNGEIYNYVELRNRLMAEGFRFRSSGDTEVLLAALTAWGDSALDMVDGMFAIAFVDVRSRRVLLARDHLGIKPLYVSSQKDCLAFASEVRALLASGVVSRDLDPAGVASYFAFGAPQDPLTVHREVRSFPAGACQWIQVDESGRPKAQGSPRIYWRAARTWEKGGSQESDENPAEIRSLFLRTVEQQCQSDVPLGVLLSAGLDSTLIASAVKASGFDLKTFSVGVDDKRVDTEVSVARRTAARLDSEHHEFILNDHNIQGLWDGWLRVSDRPGVDGFNTYLACRSIHGSCVKVALSGVGADELFGGYGSFIRARRLGGAVRLWQWMPLSARKFLARSVVELAGERFRKHQWRIDLLSSLRSSRPTDLAIALKRLLGNLEIQGLGFDAPELGLMDDYLCSEASAALWFDEADSFRAVSGVETCLYMQNTLLRDSDINSMANSLELRVPFLGRRLVEQALKLPSSVHINARRVGKQVLRRALSDLVPDEVLNRPKTGFALPFERWMFTTLLDSCEAAIEGLREMPFLNYGRARAMWERFKKNPYSSHWLRPMLLVAMGSYADSNARTFIDAAGAIKIRARKY